MDTEIMVSIICNAYNHEKYIRDALESFVIQKTNFKFEVLVHDDASTDATADIIKEYEVKYPGLIKPIYQTENQYSKDPDEVGKIQRARVKGKYTAICEGDDYWSDPYKLQKQFDAMEKHPELDICAHTSMVVDSYSGKSLENIQPSEENTIFNVEQVIMRDGGFVATNSLFYRSDVYSLKYRFRELFNFDYSLQITASLRGGMLYLSDCMSVYRYMTENSWSAEISKNVEKMKTIIDKKINMLQELDKETGEMYTKTIHTKIKRCKFDKLLLENSYKQLKKSEYIDLYRRLALSTRIKLKFKYYFPWIVTLKKMLNRKSGIKHIST